MLAPPPERRVYPAARRAALGLPDESGVPIGIAARLGGNATHEGSGAPGGPIYRAALSPVPAELFVP